MALNGIDIASYQAGINLEKVPCDFVIVKATQGTNYVNPDMHRALQQAIGAGKLIGVYHYASKGGAENEALHFLKTVRAYVGKAILVLDWEEGDNANFPSEVYAKRFLDLVQSETSVTPFIYAGKYNVQTYGWKRIAEAGYPLWFAQYKNWNNQTASGYQKNPWTDSKGLGAWREALIHQYTSVGVLKGWSGRLDLNIAYMSRTEWLLWAKTRDGDAVIPKKPVNGASRVNTTGYPLTKYGHRNEYVRLLQNALTMRGFPCQPDGIFGAETSKQVRAFQESRKLVPDSIVGQLTWQALFS